MHSVRRTISSSTWSSMSLRNLCFWGPPTELPRAQSSVGALSVSLFITIVPKAKERLRAASMLSFHVTEFQNRNYTVVSRPFSYRILYNSVILSETRIRRTRGYVQTAFGLIRLGRKQTQNPELFGINFTDCTYEFNCRQPRCSKQQRLRVVFGRCRVRILVLITAGLSGICSGFVQHSHENDGTLSK